jgi:hypothetical protein
MAQYINTLLITTYLLLITSPVWASDAVAQAPVGEVWGVVEKGGIAGILGLIVYVLYRFIIKQLDDHKAVVELRITDIKDHSRTSLERSESHMVYFRTKYDEETAHNKRMADDLKAIRDRLDRQ